VVVPAVHGDMGAAGAARGANPARSTEWLGLWFTVSAPLLSNRPEPAHRVHA
jgi:hypothetical protein